MREQTANNTYSDMLGILGKMNIIDLELAEKLSNLGKFRNKLIHFYTEIDNLKVLEYIQKELVDINQFIARILGLIGESQS